MKKRRVLLAEDNPANTYLARFLLEQHGLEVEHVRNGIECLARARLDPPHLVLLDLQMPLMDGFETARELRADPNTCHLPLVAASAYAMAGDRERALAAGFCDYIEKPFEPTTFASRVASHLQEVPKS
jgi:CheY-like chemotaxis protein